jgi:hypothetical protein
MLQISFVGLLAGRGLVDDIRSSTGNGVAAFGYEGASVLSELLVVGQDSSSISRRFRPLPMWIIAATVPQANYRASGLVHWHSADLPTGPQ